MADGGSLVSPYLLLILVAALCVASSSSSLPSSRELPGAGGGGWGERKVGGRTEIPDVKENKEVQELGHFAVMEHNHLLPRSTALVFGGVVRAERQVVSGVKYYLQVVAEPAAAGRCFDAVVVVKPWLGSRELLSFTPSPSYLHHHQ